MKKKFVDNCMKIILSYNNGLSKKDIDKYRYGLEGLYLNVTKIIFILILAIILKIFKETILLLLIFNGIRFFAFGVHAKRSIDCLISSTLLFIGFPILCIKLNIPNIIKYISFIPIFTLILIYAPSDTIKRPLNNKNKRIIYKILSTIVSIIYMFLCIYIKDNTLSNCFLFALIIQVIIILPITYKIFDVPYNNHKIKTN